MRGNIAADNYDELQMSIFFRLHPFGNFHRHTHTQKPCIVKQQDDVKILKMIYMLSPATSISNSP